MRRARLACCNVGTLSCSALYLFYRPYRTSYNTMVNTYNFGMHLLMSDLGNLRVAIQFRAKSTSAKVNLKVGESICSMTLKCDCSEAHVGSGHCLRQAPCTWQIREDHADGRFDRRSESSQHRQGGVSQQAFLFASCEYSPGGSN